MESHIREDVAKAMGCQLQARPKSDQLFIRGVGPGGIPVKYNAVVRLQIPRARLVISRNPDPLSTKELRLANTEEDLGFTWKVPCIPECVMPCLLGSTQFRDHDLREHHQQGLVTACGYSTGHTLFGLC